jgi:hypothetical protein
VYVRSPGNATHLEPAELWHLDDAPRFQSFREVTEATSFPLGIGLPGRVWASGRPEWIVDVTRDDNFPRAKLLRNIGLKAGFAFPVIVGGEVAAVVEFFSPESRVPDVELMDILEQVGRQLGRVAERERSRGR